MSVQNRTLKHTNENLSSPFFPQKQKFLQDALKKSTKPYTHIPISLAIRADYDTPLSIYKKLDHTARALLESVESISHNKSHLQSLGRYSLVALGERITITLEGKNIKVHPKPPNEKADEVLPNPLVKIKRLLQSYHTPTYDNLPPFYAGFIGYLGYETVQYFENIPDVKENILGVPDGILFFPDTVIVCDNVKHTQTLITLCQVTLQRKNVETDEKILYRQYQRTTNKLKKIAQKILHQHVKIKRRHYFSKLVKPSAKQQEQKVHHYFTQKQFMQGVEQCKKYIEAGEGIQVVLSKLFAIPCVKDALTVYCALRSLNPSPYLYLLKFNGFFIIGSSPEILVKLHDKKLLLKPLAGTRKRGKNAAEDKILTEDLLADSKETSEHLMLVDLGRNDLGRIAKAGSVQVTNFMSVDYYSHVMHIVSSVHAEIENDKDAFDAIAAVFPAGTLSGAPKVRAMEIISELEPHKRGPYGGTILCIGVNDYLDSCITIRTIVLKDKTAFVQAGAGIVFQSKAKNEHNEIINKAAPLIEVVQAIEQNNRFTTP